MNALIHLVAAFGAFILVLMILRLQKRNSFLGELLNSQALNRGARRITIIEPQKFMANFASALGIRFENHGALHLAMTKVDPQPLVETFLRYGITLIRCELESKDPAIHVSLGSAVDDPAAIEAVLAKALGQSVRIVVSYKSKEV
jgi:hypothetical protein